MAIKFFYIFVMFPLVSQALEVMDDASLSNVVAQEGIHVVTEYKATNDTVQYHDDKDSSKSIDSGDDSFNSVDINIISQVQQIADIKVVKK
ncbi:MAG: hypothetical protein ACI9DG_000648 [Oleispira sp.]|jgi:hypothetical protein